MNGEQIAKLGRYGLVGVMLALIILAGLGMLGIWQMATKNGDVFAGAVERNTEAWVQNTQALTALKTTIDLKIKK